MTLYEYRCKSCGDQIVQNERLEGLYPGAVFGHRAASYGTDLMIYVDEALPSNVCGPLKRTWSVGFQIKSTDWSH